MTTQGVATCHWCGGSFCPRRGGSPQLFCRSACRVAFHSAARRWAEGALVTGTLTIGDIRNASPEACTLLGAMKPVSQRDRVLPGALRHGRQRLVLELPICVDAVRDLVHLGWLSVERLRDTGAVADAVIDLADAALAAGLRPFG